MGNINYEAYLAAHASVASEDVSALSKNSSSEESSSKMTTENTEVIASKPKNAIKYFPTAGDSLWQLESFNDPAKGKYRNGGVKPFLNICTCAFAC